MRAKIRLRASQGSIQVAPTHRADPAFDYLAGSGSSHHSTASHHAAAHHAAAHHAAATSNVELAHVAHLHPVYGENSR